MLDSVKIQRRQSEIRQTLSELVGKDTPNEEETRQMDDLDREYRSNETRYRAALTVEDEERREAGAELETRSDKEWADMMAGFEMRQVVLSLDEGRNLEGQTNEIVSELRSNGGYRGVPVPWEALEVRNTVSSDTPSPIGTRPIIDRLFPGSVAALMGVSMVNIGVGDAEWPVVTSSVTAGWAPSEGGNVAGPTQFTTVDRPMKPDNTMGVQMRVSRKALKQSGAALEQAVRRDMNGAMSQEMDRAVFQGTGSGGEPLGIMAGAATYGIAETAIDAAPTYAAFLTEIVAFMTANTVTAPNQVRALIRPEMFGFLESNVNADLHMSEYYRLAFLLAGRQPEGTFPQNISVSSNALPAPSGGPAATSMLLTTSTGGIAPAFVGTWGAVDLIRDPYSDAQSGGLRLTALTTMDVTVARPVQTRILTGLEV